MHEIYAIDKKEIYDIKDFNKSHLIRGIYAE